MPFELRKKGLAPIPLCLNSNDCQILLNDIICVIDSYGCRAASPKTVGLASGPNVSASAHCFD